MPSTVHSFSVKETDTASEERLKRLADYAFKKGVSASYIFLEAFEHYEKQVIGELWQPRQKQK